MKNEHIDLSGMKVFMNGQEVGYAQNVEVEFDTPEEKVTPFSYSMSGTMTLETGIITRRYKRPDGTVWEVRTFDTGARRLEDCIILDAKKVRDNGVRRRHRAIEQVRKEMFKHIVRHEGIEGIINRVVAEWKS